MIYKSNNSRKRMVTNIRRATVVKGKERTLLTGDDEVNDRWICHSDDLFKVECERGFRSDYIRI